MQRHFYGLLILALALSFGGFSAHGKPSLLAKAARSGAPTSSEAPHAFRIYGDHFVLDGKPFQIISGEMHYARIPREYWRDRLKKARAMGLNTVSTYVFWNVHEPKPGVYDFNGGKDVAAFIRMAQEEGLYVILRPGPYSCAEWDLGGFPAWLLADPNIVLRSTDEKFMGPAERWLKRLGQELAPLQIARGGPIIAVQVENEYGSFGNDKEYMRRILAALKNAGLGEALLYTADGADELAAGTLPELPAVVNFGPGEANEEFAKLEKFRPGAPVMSGEYWAGWFDHWGTAHETRDSSQQAQEIDWILRQGYSINLYMFHGGTSFGFMSGANWDHNNYEPDVTSYDYDSPVSESGILTKKYFALRDVIAKHRPGVAIPQPPVEAPRTGIPEFQLERVASLWENLPSPVRVEQPRNMEAFCQSYGYILYRTIVKVSASGELVLPQLRSYARVYVNRKLVGMADRRKKQDRVNVKVDVNDQLDLLVEGTGRINFSIQLRNERQGINGPVLLAGHELSGWEVFLLPMDDLSNLRFSALSPDDISDMGLGFGRPDQPSVGPAFYQGHFDLFVNADTFLDTRGWGKGVVWINGHALGRFWNIGPQQTLYVPAPWLKAGKNEVIVFTLGGKSQRMRGLISPILDQVGSE